MFPVCPCIPCNRPLNPYSSDLNGENTDKLCDQLNCLTHPSQVCMIGSSALSMTAFAMSLFTLKWQLSLLMLGSCTCSCLSYLYSPVHSLREGVKKLAQEVDNLFKRIVELGQIADDIERVKEHFDLINKGMKNISGEMGNLINNIESNVLVFYKSSESMNQLSSTTLELATANETLVEAIESLNDFYKHKNELENALRSHASAMKKNSQSNEAQVASNPKVCEHLIQRLNKLGSILKKEVPAPLELDSRPFEQVSLLQERQNQEHEDILGIYKSELQKLREEIARLKAIIEKNLTTSTLEEEKMER